MLSIMTPQHDACNRGVTLDKSLLLPLAPRHYIGHPSRGAPHLPPRNHFRLGRRFEHGVRFSDSGLSV